MTRKLEEIVTIDAFQFRCVKTYGERVKSNGANWIQISPDTASVRYFQINAALRAVAWLGAVAAVTPRIAASA